MALNIRFRDNGSGTFDITFFQIDLEAAATATASVTGLAGLEHSVAVSVAASATLSGGISLTLGPSGDATATATAVGSVTASLSVSATVTAAATVIGAPTGIVGLTGSALAAATIEGVATGVLYVESSAICIATATGSVTGLIFPEAAVLVEASAVGALVLSLGLSSSVVGEAFVTGESTNITLIEGAAYAYGILYGSLEVRPFHWPYSWPVPRGLLPKDSVEYITVDPVLPVNVFNRGFIAANSPWWAVENYFVLNRIPADRKDLGVGVRVYRVPVQYMYQFPYDATGHYMTAGLGTYRLEIDDPTVNKAVLRDWFPVW